MNKNNLILNDVVAVLTHQGISGAMLVDEASELVLFGSRAADVHHSESDWDLLLVGEGDEYHSNELDLVVVSPCHIWSDDWLGSELASHVASYGVWLKGEGRWRTSATPSRKAVERKVHRLVVQVSTYSRLFSGSQSPLSNKHRFGLRRDLQRVEAMLRGAAVAPTPILDKEWTEFNQDDRLRFFDIVSGQIPVGPRDAWLQVLSTNIE